MSEDGFKPRAMGARLHEANAVLAQALADLEAVRRAKTKGEPLPAAPAPVLQEHMTAAFEVRGHMRVMGYDVAATDGRDRSRRAMDIGVVAEGLGHTRRRGAANIGDQADAETVHDAMAERGCGIVSLPS